MKIRTGFVSNSSSSSFVVQFKNNFFRHFSEEQIATEEDVKKLVNYGFELSRETNPFDLPREEGVNFDNTSSEEEKWLCSLKFKVTCNQSYVIGFLVKNNIPFKASVHYDNEFWLFKRGDSTISVFQNFGQIVAMYGEEELLGREPFNHVDKHEKRCFLEEDSDEFSPEIGPIVNIDRVLKIMKEKIDED